MTQDKKDFIEAMLTWFRSPKVGNDEELDRRFLASAYDNITQPHWISVEDKLPMVYEPVLAAFGNHYARVCFYCGGKWYIDAGVVSDEVFGVSHWIQIPAPPTVAKNATVKKGGEHDTEE